MCTLHKKDFTKKLSLGSFFTFLVRINAPLIKSKAHEFLYNIITINSKINYYIINKMSYKQEYK